MSSFLFQPSMNNICCFVVIPGAAVDTIYAEISTRKETLQELSKKVNEDNFMEVLKQYDPAVKIKKEHLFTEWEGDKLSTLKFQNISRIDFDIKNFSDANSYIEVIIYSKRLDRNFRKTLLIKPHEELLDTFDIDTHPDRETNRLKSKFGKINNRKY